MKTDLQLRDRLIAKAENVELIRTPSGDITATRFETHYALAWISEQLGDKDSVEISIQEWSRVFFGTAHKSNMVKAKHQVRRMIRTFLDIHLLAMPVYQGRELVGIKRIARIPREDDDHEGVRDAIADRRQMAAKNRDLSQDHLETIDAIVADLLEEGDTP